MAAATATTSGVFVGEGEVVCDGDMVWDACHSACPQVCGEKSVKVCPMMCVPGCACPRGRWLLVHEDGESCVEDCDAVVGGERDDHNCLNGAGYVWCETVGDCVRPWTTDCPPPRDTDDRNMVSVYVFLVLASAAGVACRVLRRTKSPGEKLPLAATPETIRRRAPAKSKEEEGATEDA